jgi:hypothetical protein
MERNKGNILQTTVQELLKSPQGASIIAGFEEKFLAIDNFKNPKAR